MKKENFKKIQKTLNKYGIRNNIIVSKPTIYLKPIKNETSSSFPFGETIINLGKIV